MLLHKTIRSVLARTYGEIQLMHDRVFPRLVSTGGIASQESFTLILVAVEAVMVIMVRS